MWKVLKNLNKKNSGVNSINCQLQVQKWEIKKKNLPTVLNQKQILHNSLESCAFLTVFKVVIDKRVWESL